MEEFNKITTIARLNFNVPNFIENIYHVKKLLRDWMTVDGINK